MTRVGANRYRCVPRLQALEDRTMLSTCHVTRFGDAGVGMGFRGDLRYCINKVNTNPGADIIDFKIAGNTIDLTSPLPELTSDIDIQGPGYEALWVAGYNHGIFTVNSAATVEISGLSLVAAHVNDGGAVYNTGTLTIHDARLMQNNVSGDGGGIYNTGNLTVRDSLIIGNSGDRGGGIYNVGTATIETTVITENVAVPVIGDARGGGIYNGGTLSITSSSVVDNVAVQYGAFGGGIYNVGMLWVDSTTVAGNAANLQSSVNGGVGGGICNYTGGVATIRNSTIANNESSDYGGGIIQFGTAINIDHSTISGNVANDGGGGIWSDFDSTVSLRNTIVAANTVNDHPELGPDLRGQFASAGYNLIGDTTAASGFVESDILDVDPMLGSLADNGGPTLTMALLAGSPAIDAGDNTDAPEWDQRGPGFPRIVNGNIDIGAFEVQATPIPPITRPGLDLLAVVLATADLDSLI